MKKTVPTSRPKQKESSNYCGKSSKWIMVENSKLAVENSVHQTLVTNVGNSSCNLVSIFGAARQGKSFLMNCLASETNLFKISNQRESCTQGIDISRHTMDLGEFSRVDKGTPVSQPKNSKAIHVGFVDAEGQGDRDVTYDANLICPILLTSKCVIFNWKDSLQKDRILNLLGIMHKAAVNVATEGDIEIESGSDGKLFGHLHLVFRDWQYENSSERDVFNDIFKEERSVETAAAVRNQIRRSIKECFQSIDVWLFPPPVANANQLSTELNFEITSQPFREKLRELRHKLSQQLLTPMKFDGKAITGKTLGPLVQTIAETLNTGQIIQPASAYIQMLRNEVESLLSRLQVEVKEMVEILLEEIEESSAPTSDSHALPPFITQEDAKWKMRERLEQLLNSYREEVSRCVGELEGQVAQQVLSKSDEAIDRMTLEMEELLVLGYGRIFNGYIRQVRQKSDETLNTLLLDLETRCLPCEAQELLTVVNAIQAKSQAALQSLLSSHKSYQQLINEVIQELVKASETRVQLTLSRNQELILNLEKKCDQFLLDALDQMQEFVEGKVSFLYSLHSGEEGVPISEIRSEFNTFYEKICEDAEKQILKLGSFPEFFSNFKEKFTVECGKLNLSFEEKYRTKSIEVFREMETRLKSQFEREIDHLIDDCDSLDTFHEHFDKIVLAYTDFAVNQGQIWKCEMVGLMDLHLLSPLQEAMANKKKHLLFTLNKILEVKRQQQQQLQEQQLQHQQQQEQQKTRVKTGGKGSAKGSSRVSPQSVEVDDDKRPTTPLLENLNIDESTAKTKGRPRKSIATPKRTSVRGKTSADPPPLDMEVEDFDDASTSDTTAAAAAAPMKTGRVAKVAGKKAVGSTRVSAAGVEVDDESETSCLGDHSEKVAVATKGGKNVASSDFQAQRLLAQQWALKQEQIKGDTGDSSLEAGSARKSSAKGRKSVGGRKLTAEESQAILEEAREKARQQIIERQQLKVKELEATMDHNVTGNKSVKRKKNDDYDDADDHSTSSEAHTRKSRRKSVL